MGIPLCGSPHFAIFVGHNDVGFSRGLAGELKGHVGEPGHICLAALANLDKLEVASHHLVVGSVAIPELDDLPILPNLERAHGLVRVEVALPRLGFHHLVGAVGQSPGICLGDAVHHLDGGAYLAGLIESAVHIHSVDTLVGDFEQGAIQAGPTQGGQQAGFQVALFNQDAASHHFVRHSEFIDYPIIFHQDGLVGGRQQHGLVGGAFMQDVLAVGQQVIRRAGLALVVSHQGFDHLAGLVFLALHHDRVSAVVDDFKGDTGKISIPLGSGTGDSVLLLHAEAAPLYLIHGGDGDRVTILPHLDGFALPGQQHRFVCGGFFHFIGAVGQHVIAGTGTARLVRGDGHNNVAYGVCGATHYHGVGAAVDDFKINARKGGVALWCAPHLAVLLGDVNTAPDYLVFGFVL